MDLLSALLILVPFLGISLLIVVILQQRSKAEQRDGVRTNVAEEARVVQPARRVAAVRNRGRSRMTAFADDDEGGASAEDDAVNPATEGKVGTKKLAKLQAKADKKIQRENELREREERKKREEKEAAVAKKMQEQEELLEAKREEAERVAREEKERKEHEEYLLMKEQFQVDEEGFDEESESEAENRLKEFVEYVKKAKVVQMEELASQFRLKTQEAIDRLQTLIQQRDLTGVIDDRGKFIFISQAELEKVASFIHRRGRVSISDLADSSNSLISLQPDTVPA